MSHNEITLRQALPGDLNLLQHWDEQPHVIASDPNHDWGWEIELNRQSPGREHFIAELDGRPIDVIEITDPANDDSHYWGHDMPKHFRAIDIWIGETTDLSKGYGTQMMQLALTRCFCFPEVTQVLIDPLVSNTRAHRFYERLGFRFVEERQFEEDLCRVYALNRSDWEKAESP